MGFYFFIYLYHMNNILNETFQKHLTLFKTKLREQSNDENIKDLIKTYLDNSEDMAAISRSGSNEFESDARRENVSIKQQIIASKGEDYFADVDELADLIGSHAPQSDLELAAQKLGFDLKDLR